MRHPTTERKIEVAPAVDTSGPGERPTIGPVLYALGYVAVAPWGCITASLVCGLIFFLLGLLLGAPAGEAAGWAAGGVVVTGVSTGLMRWRYRASLARTWARIRAGEFPRH